MDNAPRSSRSAFRKPLRRNIVLLATLAATALMSACSSSNNSGGGSTDTSSTGGANTSTGSSNDIVVAGIQDGDFAGMDTGFQARIDRFNKAGGLNGRRIKLLKVANDGSSLSTNLSLTQTLALKDHVFAVVPVATQTMNPASAKLLAQHNIPLIGWAINPSMCGPDTFPILGCQASPQWQSLHLAAQLAQGIGTPLKGMKIAVIGIDNAGGKGGVESVAATAKIGGADVVYADAPIPQGGATDYTAYVQAMMAKKPDAIFLLPDLKTGISLTAALRQAGYRGAIWNPTAYLPGILNTQPQMAAALQGSYVVSQFPPAEQSSPAMSQIKDDLKATNAKTDVTLGVSIGWWSAEQFIQELQATDKAGDVTPANFVKTITAGFKLFQPEGGVALSFPDGQNKPAGCGGLMVAQADGTYKVAVPYSCDPAQNVDTTTAK